MMTLRIIHIGLGVFWAGSLIFLAFYLGPAIRRAGPAGGLGARMGEAAGDEARGRLGAEVDVLRARVARSSQAIAWLLIVAVVTMAAARYA